MAARLINGTEMAQQMRENVKKRVAEIAQKSKRPVYLTAILVGSTPAGELYAQRQREACKAVGIAYELLTLPDSATVELVAERIKRLNDDATVTGIMLHLPLPSHMNQTEMQYLIDPRKDVEGVNPANIGYVVYGHTLIAPCTAQAVIELIRSTGVEIRGAEAVVVGASEIAGKPIALLLAQQLATVTLCHIATRDLAVHTQRAEILVVAVGKAGLIRGEQIKQGAVLIDVGINRITMSDGTKKIVGDVDFDS